MERCNMQRLLDVIFSGIALIILLPLLTPLIIILRFTGENEIFFKQSRVGLNGNKFYLFKFATMLKDSPNIGTGTVTLHKDPRILPLGHALRKTKINELPQLINIFIGDMSVIGPRPQTQRCFDAFPKESQEKIILVRPGLSGIGSVVFRNEEQMMQNNEADNFYDNIVMPYKGLLEEWYVKNSNLYSYFSLIFITIWAILFSNQKIIWKLFKDIPKPPTILLKWIKV